MIVVFFRRFIVLDIILVFLLCFMWWFWILLMKLFGKLWWFWGLIGMMEVEVWNIKVLMMRRVVVIFGILSLGIVVDFLLYIVVMRRKFFLCCVK